MTQRSQQLLELQAMDQEIGRLTRRIDQLTAAIGDQIKVRAGELAIRQAEQAQRERQAEQRDREYELTALETRIKDHEARLYSGKGSPRDLDALQRDIEHDRERRVGLEERALEAMELTEKARAEAERMRTTVARVLAESAAGKDDQARERQSLQADLERLSQRRLQHVEAIAAADQQALTLYDRLRQKMPDGLAVAEVSQGRCEGCRTTLPSADLQRARRADAPVQCPACQRILHLTTG